jgi:anti-sigma B factor antagonist
MVRTPVLLYSSEMAAHQTGIKVEHRVLPAGASVVTVSGELDLYSLDDFKKVLADAEDSENRVIVLDLHDLGFIDSSGLGAVIGVQGRCQQGQRKLFVVPSNVISKTFEVTGLHQVLRIAESPEHALTLAEEEEVSA